MTHSSWRFSLCVILAVFICTAPLATSSLAGTTGTLGGYVFARGGAPLQGAAVAATSPSQSATTHTDSTGHFVFASLIPDTYAVTASKDGYQTVTQPGITIIADNTQNLEFTLEAQIATMAKVVVSGAVTGLLSPGTVQSVYNVTPQLTNKLSALGGGTNLNQAYSAISAVPGAFVPPFQSGWNQPIFLRGGDFNEIGYELDGIPLNRSYDNVATTNLSTFGQQALQVYTGGAPADAESHGLAGYINQVIKTGTVPGFADASAGIGSPAFYNKLSIEGGGATADRRFSYYYSVAGFNQDFRYADPFNGASLSQFGQAFDLANAAFGPLSPLPGAGVGCPIVPNGSNYAGCYANHAYFGQLPAGPGGYMQGPLQLGQNSGVTDRENVINLHYSIPHQRAGAADDIQLLYDVSQLYTYVYGSYNDWGGPSLWTNAELATPGLHAPGSFPVFVSGFNYLGQLAQPVSGTPFGPINNMGPYLFPSADQYGVNGQIPIDQRDGNSNAQALVKVQYQHDFGADEYLRIYGYSAYSNSFYTDPNFTNQIFPTARIANNDQELWAHTYGVAAEYTAQLNPANLFSASASYMSSNNTAFNNQQMTNSTPGVPFFPPSQSAFAALVSTAAPTNGTCFYYNPVTFSAPVPTSCEPTTFVPPGGPIGFNTKFVTFGGPYYPAPPGFEWLALENGPNGVTNSVTPKFIAFSALDQWRPANRIHVNLGVRLDDFQYDLASTAGGPTTAFWFKEWNLVMCANAGVNGGAPIDETTPGAFPGFVAPGTPCKALNALTGIPGWHNATIANTSPSSLQHTVVQPRLGATYEADPDDVVRLSLGSYAQPAQAQFEQYNTLQQNLANYIGGLYYSLGYTTPAHDLKPSISYNYDFSWEHRFHRTDTSFKLTPFYRNTVDKMQQFFINPSAGTVSGVNAGKQTAYGVEFLLQSGSPERNGFSALLSYTYTYSRIQYGSLPNGTTLLSPVNSAIQQYNSFTKACASAKPSTNPMAPCGVFGNTNAAATEASGVANPYFNAPLQALIDPNGSYPTYDVVPTGTQLSTASYGVPNNATFALTYHHNQLHITPLVQYVTGSRYGAPEQQLGVNPQTCAPLAGALAGDPRYPYGGTGLPYDATSCASTIVIPDQYTGKFDAIGAFTEPSYLALHAQVSYDISPRISVDATLANIYSSCFGGSNEPWLIGDHQCGYDVIPGHLVPAGNIYNPGDTIQRLVKYPYGNLLTPTPFNAFFNVNFKM